MKFQKKKKIVLVKLLKINVRFVLKNVKTFSFQNEKIKLIALKLRIEMHRFLLGLTEMSQFCDQMQNFDFFLCFSRKDCPGHAQQH